MELTEIISLKNKKNVHELQNFYYFWYLEELTTVNKKNNEHIYT